LIPAEIWEQIGQTPEGQAALRIGERLTQNGFLAYLTGGAVRDLLRGERPHDFDLATDAEPAEVERVFERTVPVGRQFGVILVVDQDVQTEVAQFRSDGPYQDGRRPSHVLKASAAEDASRRDFTVNALFFDLKERELVDHVGGLEDLKAGVLRTVGPPALRFGEDRLRLLRGIRLASQLGFQIEEQTWQAILAIGKEPDALSGVSAERIRDEMEKLFRTPQTLKGLSRLETSGVLRGFLLRLKPKSEWPLADVGRSAAWRKVESWPAASPDRRIASWVTWTWRSNLNFGDFKLSTADIKAVTAVCGWLDRAIGFLENPDDSNWVWMLTEPEARLAVSLAVELPEFKGLPAIVDRQLVARQIVLGQRPLPFLSGQDLIALGVAPGPDLGALLKDLVLEQICGRVSSREEAMNWFKGKAKID
jgi:poly(A) polymerase